MSIVEALEGALNSRETLVVRYHCVDYGDRESPVVVVKMGPGANVKIRLHGKSGEVTLSTKRILKLTLPDGTQIVNREATAMVEGYLIGYRGRQISELRISSAVVSSALPIDVLYERRHWEYTLLGVDWHKALVRAKGELEIERVCALLSHRGRMDATYWVTLAKLLECRFQWPGFDAYVCAIRAEGRALRAGALRLRETDFPLSSTHGMRRADNNARLAVYAVSEACPPSDEPRGRSRDRVRFFESDSFDPAVYFQLAEGLSAEDLGAYLAWADTAHRVRDDPTVYVSVFETTLQRAIAPS